MLGCTQEEIGRAGLFEVCMALTGLKHSALCLFWAFFAACTCAYSHLLVLIGIIFCEPWWELDEYLKLTKEAIKSRSECRDCEHGDSHCKRSLADLTADAVAGRQNYVERIKINIHNIVQICCGLMVTEPV